MIQFLAALANLLQDDWNNWMNSTYPRMNSSYSSNRTGSNSSANKYLSRFFSWPFFTTYIILSKIIQNSRRTIGLAVVLVLPQTMSHSSCLLKGQCREIFDTSFIKKKNSTWAPYEEPMSYVIHTRFGDKFLNNPNVRIYSSF